jgi:hypothetical protein
MVPLGEERARKEPQQASTLEYWRTITSISSSLRLRSLRAEKE